MGIGFEDIEERQVAVAISLLDDPIEIADRLVVMENQT
jgi:hypothetical protein